MKVDARLLRRSSLVQAQRLGYSTSEELPFLEPQKLRPAHEIVDRALCLFTVVAVTFGFETGRARAWLKKERLTAKLSQQENAFLKRQTYVDVMKARVEAIWVFAWAGTLAPALDFGEACPNTLVKLFPDLLHNESSDGFRGRFKLRTNEEVAAQCDLAYCLHWSIRDAVLNGVRPPGKLHPLFVIERRRALEWCLSTVDWDDVPMDT